MANSNGPDLGELRREVDAEIAQFLASQNQVLAGISSDLTPLIQQVESFMTGGKRLRPAFAYWGFRAIGGNHCPEIVRAAAALELLQASALMHDDYMDGSDTRRGQPATHKVFEGQHRQEGWLGEPARFGGGAAILLGDLCLVWADEMLFGSGFDDEALNRVRPVFDRMRTELMAGQYLDLLEQSRAGANLERILNVVRHKSAKYTIERPLHIGAALAGGNETQLAALSHYGLALGEAFQLRDDLLGVFGDPVVTGKPAGDDLREGKRTALVAIAYQRADASQTELLQSALGNAALSAAEVDRVRELLNELGADAEVEEMISLGRAQALAAIDAAPITEAARQVLKELAITATVREG